MNRTIISVEQIESDDGSIQINVSGKRNGVMCFVESYYIDAPTDSPLNIYLLEKEVQTSKISESATMLILTSLLKNIRRSEKRDGRLIGTEEVNTKFPINELINIRAFERIANVQFDYSKFKTLYQFQEYFRNLLRK